MAYQSLYRRYRPGRFGEIVGQEHVVRALRSSVRDGRVGHAYLFSGPRGTGKTSTARILAKALNCENLTDGEPCGECDPCRAIEAGVSYDLQELDAASNNKVEDVRDLVGKVALGSPGRTKVYILDEVHMLTTAASNALLKTLEEPPEHVKFVLATTDPHKVLPTIRSRTQHFEFTLVPAHLLAGHVAHVVDDAGLAVDAASVAHVLRAGGGSVRDTLSALEAAAAGGVSDRTRPVDALLDALAGGDTAASLAGVSVAVASGRDPRVLGEELLAALRDVFLLRMGAPVDHLTGDDRARLDGWVARMSDRTTTRALEEVGEALLEMRQAPDPRIPLEVALVRLTRPSARGSLEALAERIDRLEATLGGSPDGPGVPTGGTSTPEPPPMVEPPARGSGADPATPPAPPSRSADGAGDASSPPGEAGSAGPAGARAALSQRRPAPARPSGPAPSGPAAPRTSPPRRPRPGGGPGPERGAPAVTPSAEATRDGAAAAEGSAAGGADADRPASDAVPPSPSAASAPSPGEAPTAGAVLSREQLTIAWADAVLPRLGGLAKAMYGIGRFLEVTDHTAVFALPNEAHRRKCEQRRAEVEAALSEQVGRPVQLQLVVDDGRPGERPVDRLTDERPPPDLDEDLDLIDVRELEDSPADRRTGIDRLTDAFPGAQLLDADDLP